MEFQQIDQCWCHSATQGMSSDDSEKPRGARSVRRSSRPRKMVRRLVNEDDDVVPRRTVKKAVQDRGRRLRRRIKQEPLEDEVTADAATDAPMTSPEAGEAPPAGETAAAPAADAVGESTSKEDCDGHDSGDSAEAGEPDATTAEEAEEDANLPECKIKRNYSCSHCTYFTQNPRSYLYHLKDEHKEKIRVYECPNCLYASKHSQKLQRHVHMVHVMGRGKRKSSARSPKARKAPPDRDKAPPPLLPCSDVVVKREPAGSEEEAPGDGSAAKEAAGDEKCEQAEDGSKETYTCSQCPFSDQNKALVARHEQAVHLRKKFFRCSKCNYVTHMRARFTKHVKYHSMPMIKCDMCDFRTPYKWNLDRHYKNHTGDGAFRCSLCNFTADIKQSLTVHEMNHHVPPASAGVPVPRRRNKVGASDSAPAPAPAPAEPPPPPPPPLQVPPPHLQASPATPTRLPPPPPLQHIPTLVSDFRSQLHSSRASFEVSPFNPVLGTSTPELHSSFDHSISDKCIGSSKVPSSGIIKRSPKIKVTAKKSKVISTQEHSERHDFQADFIHPDDIIHHKNGNVYIKTLKCKSCNFKAAWGSEMARHESKVHGVLTKLTPPKKFPRPIPNLIPIQTRASVPSASKPVPILKIPTIRARDFSTSFKPGVSPLSENSLSEKDLNEICAKSCANSSLRDFASVIGDENAFTVSGEEKSKSWMDESHNTMWSEPHSIELRNNNCFSESLNDLKFESSPVGTMKKKSSSFLDQIKEKLLIGPGDSSSLVCTFCNYECKCLSEFVRHEKQHNLGSNRTLCVGGNSSTILSGTELSSTRCQHCRQRCKTSADLVIHLQSCTEANRYTKGSNDINLETSDDVCEMNGELMLNEPYIDKQETAHPMVNKVFVWNEFGQDMESDQNSQLPSDEMQEQENISVDNETESCLQLNGGCKPSDNEVGLVGFETAPGYGAVSNTSDDGTPASNSDSAATPGTYTVVKRVFKCPHCTFWASTASRFHVHIVGHLNKKPFECSLCAYRSNWRWDITKHIRLKVVRDKNHADAKVLMTDETGRRNYSKYNKYLTALRMREYLPSTTDQQRLLPTPPRLTRAPTPPADGVCGVPPGPLRPPPPLRAAHSMISSVPSQVQSQEPVVQKTISGQKRSASDAALTDKPSVEVKRTLWKCKKCNFRDASRELVLSHVKGHYQERLLSQGVASGDTPVLKNNKDNSQSPGNESTHQIIKNETQNEDVNMSMTETSLSAAGETTVKQEKEDDSFRCTICPFITNLENTLEEHLENHASQSVNDLKCTMCSYSVVDKSELSEHMKLHGVMDVEPGDDNYHHDMSVDKNSEEEENESSPQQTGTDGSMCKRYRCANCPYLSNSKSQFLYHKQFHRPRGAPFKCGICSYNVSKRHLLHQHLRVHGILIPPQKSPTKSGKESQDESADEQVQTAVSGDIKRPTTMVDHRLTSLDTSGLSQVPLVWVSRESKFFKMYKCRYCPHVNFRKANILEHEKMHTDRTKDVNSHNDSGGKAQSSNNLVQHHCPECNYICNNAGVLSSHAKVHQGFYGQIHALVDPSRTDEAQLEELSAMVNIESDCTGTKQPINNIKNEQTGSSDSSKDISLAADGTETSKKDENPQCDPSVLEESVSISDSTKRSLYFCPRCPARFLCEKELKIHRRYHIFHLSHVCEFCSYTAKQRSYLLAHMKVHTDEYQKKTDVLLEMYGSRQEYPRPQIAVDNPEAANVMWVVIDKSGKKDSRMDPRGTDKHYTCDRCPAKFLKSDSLHYHISMHGGQGQYKCKYCDYTAKTFGHLIKHENVHQDRIFPLDSSLLSTTNKVSPESVSDRKTFPQSDASEQKTISQKVSPERSGILQSVSKDRPQLHVDPQFGILMHGNPDFIYPTYLKNGRLKEKRYKCHKCPSAFEKREQYRTHLSLHGAKQRYRCEKCDYSVKYYANYIQHMRKHKDNDDAQAARLIEKKKSDHELLDIKEEITETEAETETEPASVPESEVELQSQQQKEPEPEPEPESEQVPVPGPVPEPPQVPERESELVPVPEQESEPVPEPESGPISIPVPEPESGPVTIPVPEPEPVTVTEPEVQFQPEETSKPAGIRARKSIGSTSKPGPIQMTVADRQILLLMQMKHAESLKASQETFKEQLQKSYWCPHCPYSTPQHDDLEIHIRKHTSASGIQSNYLCDYCDYSVPSVHFLREHHKLHFAQKRFATECFMKSRCIQIWRQETGETDSVETGKDQPSEDCKRSGKHLAFKDRGTSVEIQDRFEPILQVESDCVNLDINAEKKVTIDLDTGDPIDMEADYQESGDTNDSSADKEKFLEELDLETKEAEMEEAEMEEAEMEEAEMDTEIPHELRCVIKQELPDSEYAEDDSSSIVDGTIESTEYLKSVEDVCIS
ncbi:uncharacterized protein LOC126337007 isoform X2 [Schistocerca gregaria]|uniref:uncharacterized protein LOC126337007 isoform X2 n=3 Tax=Schistocerca gregaria TaxID=7010 RepID=UPI00211DF736|nr:uncharacterized protein LOC126337007 isoform X2 [Schistocerca gregaria]